MFKTIITALTSFISSNLDDIFVLMILFSQFDKKLKKNHIVAGQYLGISILTIISIIGALGVSLFPHQYVKLLGLIPIYIGIKIYLDYLKENCNNNEFNEIDINPIEEKDKYTGKFVTSNILSVAAITIANGGDNIAIYIPVFANMNLLNIFISVVAFIILTGLWCFLGYILGNNSYIQNIVEKYKYIFVPTIFILLGIFIII